MRGWIPVVLLFLILTAGWWILPAEVAGWPLCFFKHLTGWDCPGCGLTRSFLSLARGNLVEAVRFNAAGPLIYLFFLLYFIEQTGRVKLRLPAWGVKSFSFLVVFFLFGHWILRLKKQVF
ncbi:MAG: DUF2752 domain-containing protein [Deltaproteobacteria bacterium]|nr:DUF2752 domain-containing protein [Deltaproteobacteria bacterium]